MMEGCAVPRGKRSLWWVSLAVIVLLIGNYFACQRWPYLGWIVIAIVMLTIVVLVSDYCPCDGYKALAFRRNL